MKPGLRAGQSTEIEITVTQEMLAAFGGKVVHELYSTSALVQHMEQVARKLIVPYLDKHEEGMGSYVEVSHLMLTIPGMKVRLKATVSDVRDNKIIAVVEAYNPRGRIARGVVTQAIVEKAWLEKKMKELSLIHQLAQESESAARS